MTQPVTPPVDPFAKVDVNAFAKDAEQRFLQERAAAQAATAPPAPAAPATFTPADQAALYEPYRQAGKTFDLWTPDGKQIEYRHGIDELLKTRGAGMQGSDGTHYDDYQVTVRDPTGARKGIRVGDIDKALAEGFQLEDTRQGAVARYLDDHKGLKGDVVAGLESFLDEATLGVNRVVSDHVLSPEQRALDESLKADHAAASTAGAIGGFGTSLLYGGPAFKGAAKVGDLAAHAVTSTAAKALGTRLAEYGVEHGAESVARQILAKSLGAGAKLGTESLAFAMPAAVTEAALGDPQAAAESLLWNVGVGAALGTVGGGGKELLGRALKGLVIAPGSGTIAAKLDGYASEQAVKSLNPLKRISDSLARTEGGIEGAGRVIRERGLNRRVGEGFEDLTDRIASEAEKTGEQIGATYKALDDKGVVFDGKALAADLRREVLAPLEKKVGYEGFANKVERYIDSFEGKAIGEAPEAPTLLKMPKEPAAREIAEADVLAELKAKHKGQGLRFAPAHRDKFLQEAEGGTLAELTAQRNATAAAEAQAKYAEKVARVEATNAERTAQYQELVGKHGQLGAGDVWNIRRDLDRLLYGEGLPNPEQIDKELQAIRGMYKERLDAAVSDHLGEAELAKLKKLNHEYGVLSIVEKGARQNIGRDVSNRTNGLTDYLLGMTGASVGGPLGTLAGMFGNKWMRENYNTLAMHGADKLGVLFTEQALRKSGQQLERVPSVLGELTAGHAKGLPGRSVSELLDHDGDRPERFKRAADRLAAAQSNMMQTEQHLAKVAGALAEGGAPEVAKAYIDVNRKALQYLWETMPKQVRPPPMFGRKGHLSDVSERAMQAWERRVEIVENPYRVLDHVKHGTLTRDHLEALDRVYPATRSKVLAKLAEADAAPNAPVLPPAVRAQVQRLMAGSTSPAETQRYQAVFGPAPASGDGQGGPIASSGATGGGPDLSTETQRVSAK